ncbi:MAG: PAS domain S-box protein, partial [Spirochaetota bacterium]
HLVLMDIILAGEIDGIETAEKIYNQYNIPFIYITSSTDQNTFDRAKKSLPQNYIVKPFSSYLLKSAIDMALYRFDMENRLKESEANSKKILSAIPDIFFEINPDGEPVDEKYTEIVEKYWNMETNSKAQSYFSRAMENGEVQFFEYEMKDGDKSTFYDSRIVHTGEENFLVIIREITERKKAEAAMSRQMTSLEDEVKNRTGELQKLNTSLIQEIEKRNIVEGEIRLFIDATEQSSNAIVIIESNGVVKYVNRRFCEISGYSKVELVGLVITEKANPITPEPGLLESIASAKNWKGEMYNTSKSGEVYFLMAYISKIMNNDGQVGHFLLTGDDITEKKKEEAELLKAEEYIKKSGTGSIDRDMDWQSWKEKMLERNISRTDRSIFSNINNSFTQGAGFGTLITFMEMMDRTAKKNNGMITVESGLFDEAMKNVVIAQNAFKIFAGIDWITSNEIELEVVTVRDIFNLIKNSIKKAEPFVKINKNRVILNEFPASLKKNKININSEYFSDAVYELIINALKFSRQNTSVLVLLFSQGNNLRISVLNDPQKAGDDIIGIPAEYERIVFEPFFRISKLVHEKYNTLDFGLGLTYVDKVMVRHGGEIIAENIADYSDVKKDPIVKVNLMMSLPFAQ